MHLFAVYLFISWDALFLLLIGWRSISDSGRFDSWDFRENKKTEDLRPNSTAEKKKILLSWWGVVTRCFLLYWEHGGQIKEIRNKTLTNMNTSTDWDLCTGWGVEKICEWEKGGREGCHGLVGRNKRRRKSILRKESMSVKITSWPNSSGWIGAFYAKPSRKRINTNAISHLKLQVPNLVGSARCF